MKFFVHYDVEYYPYAEIVEADTPEQAVAMSDYERSNGVVAAVVPFDAVVLVGDPESQRSAVHSWTRDGART
jgi:hypothetical protein